MAREGGELSKEANPLEKKRLIGKELLRENMKKTDAKNNLNKTGISRTRL